MLNNLFLFILFLFILFLLILFFVDPLLKVYLKFAEYIEKKLKNKYKF